MWREVLLLQEMIQAAMRARSIVEGFDVVALEADQLRREALLWNFTVLGEAASQLDASVKERFPDIDWARPTKLRNRIVHGYWSVDLEILRTTAHDDLPALAERLRAALRQLQDDPDGEPGE